MQNDRQQPHCGCISCKNHWGQVLLEGKLIKNLPPRHGLLFHGPAGRSAIWPWSISKGNMMLFSAVFLYSKVQPVQMLVSAFVWFHRWITRLTFGKVPTVVSTVWTTACRMATGESASRCDHHTISCKHYAMLKPMLHEIADPQLGDEEHEHNIRPAIAHILEWEAHIVRSFNQHSAKTSAPRFRDNTTCVITQDWAMKFLPQRYREQTVDWYGKRGICMYQWCNSSFTSSQTALRIVVLLVLYCSKR